MSYQEEARRIATEVNTLVAQSTEFVLPDADEALVDALDGLKAPNEFKADVYARVFDVWQGVGLLYRDTVLKALEAADV